MPGAGLDLPMLPLTSGDRICDKIWPSSLVLCQFIKDHPKLFVNKIILELGAGIGMVSAMALLHGAKHVILQDMEDLEGKQSELMELNGINRDRWSSIQSRWGADKIDVDCDVIVSSDTFYEPSCFAPLLETVKSLLKPGMVFITAYHERDIEYDLEMSLKLRGLKLARLYPVTDCDDVMTSLEEWPVSLEETVFIMEITTAC